jgi:hypothetical protein
MQQSQPQPKQQSQQAQAPVPYRRQYAMTANAYAQCLRALARFLDDNPNLPPPHEGTPPNEIHWFLVGPVEQQRAEFLAIMWAVMEALTDVGRARGIEFRARNNVYDFYLPPTLFGGLRLMVVVDPEVVKDLVRASYVLWLEPLPADGAKEDAIQPLQLLPLTERKDPL